MKTLLAPGAQLRFIAPARLLQTFEGPEPKRLFTHFGQGGADDQRIASFQDSLVPQMIQRGQELPTRQIAGRTDDDENVRLNLMFRHLQDPPCERSTVSSQDAEKVALCTYPTVGAPGSGGSKNKGGLFEHPAENVLLLCKFAGHRIPLSLHSCSEVC